MCEHVLFNLDIVFFKHCVHSSLEKEEQVCALVSLKSFHLLLAEKPVTVGKPEREGVENMCAQCPDKFAYIHEITQGVVCAVFILAYPGPGSGHWLSETSLKYQEPPLPFR